MKADQMREAFEKFHFNAFGFSILPEGGCTNDMRDFLYKDTCISSLWKVWQAAYQARQPEIDALRAALEAIAYNDSPYPTDSVAHWMAQQAKAALAAEGK